MNKILHLGHKSGIPRAGAWRQMRATRVVLLGTCVAALMNAGIPVGALAESELEKGVSVAARDQAQAPRKSWMQRHFGRPAWEEVKGQGTTPREICGLVGKYISYRSEEVDRWASAEETWKRGRGDCEDFATFVEQACHEMGFDASVELYFPAGRPGEGHAVAVGRWEGRMWMSDTGDYREVQSVEEVRDRVSRVLECDAAEMWTVRLDHDGVERTLNRHAARAMAPVARSHR